MFYFSHSKKKGWGRCKHYDRGDEEKKMNKKNENTFIKYLKSKIGFEWRVFLRGLYDKSYRNAKKRGSKKDEN